MIIIFFDLGFFVFLIGIIIYGILLALQDAAVASVGIMVDNFTKITLLYLAVNVVIAAILYFALYGKKELKRHLCNFVAWILAYILMTIPVILIIYFAIIPQAFTSLGNMIVSGIFFFFVICGFCLFYLWGLSLISESKGDNKNCNNRKRNGVYWLFFMAVVSLVGGYLVNHIAITHTTSEIYIKLYGEELGAWLVRWVNGINQRF